jgi:hypothetical protein
LAFGEGPETKIHPYHFRLKKYLKLSIFDHVTVIFFSMFNLFIGKG